MLRICFIRFSKKKMRHDLRYDVTLANEWRWVMNLFDYRLKHIGNFFIYFDTFIQIKIVSLFLAFC